MNKTNMVDKVIGNLEEKFPSILKDNDKEDVIKAIKESMKLFTKKHDDEIDEENAEKEESKEEAMINAIVDDVATSFGLEDFEIDFDMELDDEFDQGNLSYMQTYEEKFKNIEKTIAKGSGSLTDEEKDILAAKNIPLIHSIVKRFANTGIEYTELLSAGYVGYAKGLQTFKKGKNVKFSTYAYRCIKNEILYFLRREKRHKDNDVSLSKPMSTDKNGNVMTVESTISTEDMGARSLEDEVSTNETIKIMINIIDEYLTETEATIIKSRYGIGMIKPRTQKEIADEIGMSQANISKLEKGITDKIKKIMSSKYKIKNL